MERHAIQKQLPSYTINHQLIETLTAFFSQTLPACLAPDLAGCDLEDYATVTIVHAGESIRFGTLRHFKGYALHNKVDGLLIELDKIVHSKGTDKAIVLQLSFGKDVEDNFLRVALQDDAVRTKLSVIGHQLLDKLAPYRNNHSRLFRNEGVHTFFFFICAVFGTLAFAFPDPPYSLLSGTGAIVGLCLFLLASVRGYPSFKLA